MTLGRKLISLFLLLTVIITPLTLTSCDRSYNKDEVISEAKRLLTDAHMLYSVYYGNGIMHHGGGHSEGDYEEADVIHLHQLGFETIDELKELTYKTFSEKYTESIIDNYLTSFEEDGIVYNFARYVQLYDGEDLDIPSVILVYSKHKPIFEDRMTYDLDTVKDVKSEGDYVKMTVEVTVLSEDGESQRAELDFTMYEEKSGWRIASPCFANYNKYIDNELLK
ncbi:MAG: hypothetical protein IKC87_04885 [Clostridia bacterium]|nr:hypothetical protein [Clostridia bacterium]